MEKPLKILIVEDNPEELEYAKSIVELVNSLTPEERALRTFYAYEYYNYFTDEGIKRMVRGEQEWFKKCNKPFDEKVYVEELIINSRKEWLDSAKELAPTYSGYFLEPTYATDLTQALRELNKKSGLTAVISDVFYPLGQEPMHKEELFRILGEGMYELSGRGEYYREQLAKGQVSESDVPSGVVLAL